MKFIQSHIPGCIVIEGNIIGDNRGTFIKNFNYDIFLDNNIDVNFYESYFSRSHKSVIRGMHYQNPPHEISKLIFCSEGEVIDVFLDLRKNSKTFGNFDSIKLSRENGKHVYLPKGIAHGFQVLSDSATIHYLQSGAYIKESESGILWDSFSMNWPIKNPIISNRDSKFMTFEEYRKINR